MNRNTIKDIGNRIDDVINSVNELAYILYDNSSFSCLFESDHSSCIWFIRDNTVYVSNFYEKLENVKDFSGWNVYAIGNLLKLIDYTIVENSEGYIDILSNSFELHGEDSMYAYNKIIGFDEGIEMQDVIYCDNCWKPLDVLKEMHIVNEQNDGYSGYCKCPDCGTITKDESHFAHIEFYENMGFDRANYDFEDFDGYN